MAARAVLDAGGSLRPADHPHLQAEVTAGAVADLAAAVALVETTAAAWITASAAIKTTRRRAKIAIAAAPDLAAIQTILAGLAWPTPDISGE